MSLFDYHCALDTYRAEPNPSALRTLLLTAADLLPPDTWRNVRHPRSTSVPWMFLRVQCDRHLHAEEIARLHDCLTYALKAASACESLPPPSVYFPSAPGLTLTVLDMSWNSRSSPGVNIDYPLAFARARQYIFEGTPVRPSNREGGGTRGMRLFEGIACCSLSFFVR